MQTLQLFLMFLLILSKNLRTLQNISDSDDGVFIAKDECQMGKSSNYKEEIEKARKSLSPCSTDPKDVESVCHQNVIDSDLGIFQKNGITHNTLDEATKYGRRCKIYNRRLYRESNCMFASRCEGIPHFILKLLPELPDMDFVINTRGWPQVPLKQYFQEFRYSCFFQELSVYFRLTEFPWVFLSLNRISEGICI
ncbi:O-glucosyltransferase rumi-like [Glossina fuscipes fuscipes]